MVRSTAGTDRIFKLYPDESAARIYIESRRWPNAVTCPACEETERITPRKNGFYRCNACKKDFTVRTGTIFERSHVELHRWIYAMHLLMTSHNNLSSLQLGKEIGVTQKTAWFMLGRIREACGNDFAALRGIVDIVSKDRNKHSDKTLDRGRSLVGH